MGARKKHVECTFVMHRENISGQGYRWLNAGEDAIFPYSYRAICPTCGEVWLTVHADRTKRYWPLSMHCRKHIANSQYNPENTLISGGYFPTEGIPHALKSINRSI